MKKCFVLIPIFAMIFFSCNNSTVFPPLTSEPVVMGVVDSDAISFSTSPGYAIKTANLGSGALNFRDRDSTIISFYYSGTTGNTTDYSLLVYDSTSSQSTVIHKFVLDSISSTERFIQIMKPSHQDFASYHYEIKCSGATPQSFAIRKLTLSKK